MKRIIGITNQFYLGAAFLAVLLFSTAASAQTYGYMGLFTDETHTSWCNSAATWNSILPGRAERIARL